MGRPHRIDIRRNDQVKVLAGKDLKEGGRVLRVIRSKQRVVVEGINMVKRHTRPNPSRNLKGGIVEREGPIHLSNVHDRLRSLWPADPNRSSEAGGWQEDPDLS